ncbi:DUF4418 family protein [Sutterella sp.]|uniref:DUF4418 family protein n=1 Tax=Sutterella sp. TaxID=1981025 RepID=UPI0026E08236|nr:DUF4418 family protein [Sutterella sp.]MDO5531376.1 DUF4418 family protein [Sutterella sp.]
MSASRPALVSGLVFALAGFAVAAALVWWLPHCHAELPMRCVWMTRANMGTGVLIGLLGLAMMFAGVGSAMGLATGIVLSSLLMIAVATVLIGPCPNPMMGCHAVTEPALIVIGAVIALAGLAELWRLSRVR